jgi:excisionase family DNA binding protein
MEPRYARFAPWLSFGACPVSFSPSKLCSSHIPRRPPGSCPDLTDADGRRRSTFICPQEWVEQVVKRVRALYDVPEAMALLNLSRTQIYELIRSRRLVTVTQGRRRLVPAASISAYVELLLQEAGGDDGRAA